MMAVEHGCDPGFGSGSQFSYAFGKTPSLSNLPAAPAGFYAALPSGHWKREFAGGPGK